VSITGYNGCRHRVGRGHRLGGPGHPARTPSVGRGRRGGGQRSFRCLSARMRRTRWPLPAGDEVLRSTDRSAGPRKSFPGTGFSFLAVCRVAGSSVQGWAAQRISEAVVGPGRGPCGGGSPAMQPAGSSLRCSNGEDS